MPFMLGLLTTTVMTLAAIAGAVITGIYAHSLSILFIIPVGAILAGMGCGSGVYWGLVASRQRKPRDDVLRHRPRQA